MNEFCRKMQLKGCFEPSDFCFWALLFLVFCDTMNILAEIGISYSIAKLIWYNAFGLSFRWFSEERNFRLKIV